MTNLERDEFSAIDERSHPHVKLQDACVLCSDFVFKFVLDNPWDFGELKAMMNMWRFLGKLNKMRAL
jgi:hypothetical protein